MHRYILSVALMCAGAANAVELQTGNDFLRLVNGSELDKVYAYGYLAGVSQGEQFGQALADIANGGLKGFKFYCVPSAADIGQTSAVVAKWLSEHPARRHEAIFILARDALVEAWPCKK